MACRRNRHDQSDGLSHCDAERMPAAHPFVDKEMCSQLPSGQGSAASPMQGERDRPRPAIVWDMPELLAVSDEERKLFAACFGDLINQVLSEP